MLQQLKKLLAGKAEHRISVRVTPKSKHNQLTDVSFDQQKGISIKLKIIGVPEKGQVNAELVDYLADILDLPKSCIKILSGFTGRQKIILISNHAL